MKNFVVFVIAILSGTVAAAQYDTTAPYLKTKMLPDFTVLSLDSVAFNQSVLQDGKNTLVMLFNPGCEHCQEQLQQMLTIPAFTRATNVVLCSTEPLQKIKVFYNKFHLEKYPLIHIGKDYKYFFGGFYQPKTIPVLAFYNKQKKLLYFNQGNVKKKKIEEVLKN